MTEIGEAGDGPGAAERRRVAPKSAREILQPEEVPPPPVRSRGARHPLVVALNFFLTIAILAVVVVGGIALYTKLQFDQTGPLAAERIVPISPGSGLTEIAETLEQTGAISSRWIFRIAVTFHGNQGRLQAGEYRIPAQATMHEIMDLMVEGGTVAYVITFPEGLTSRQIVDRLLANDVLVGEINEVPAEGTLLPDTYYFSRGDTRQSVLDRMTRDHNRVVQTIWNNRAADLPLRNIRELVTLASIVECETRIADERSRVAAVFINRLRRPMRLQADPTVIYGIYGECRGHELLLSELERQTPYNTYLVDGLPPGPIANPGRAALEAVANPSQTNDLYFVADGTGGHVFATTLEEHNRNVQRWRQIQQQATPTPAPAP